MNHKLFLICLLFLSVPAFAQQENSFLDGDFFTSSTTVSDVKAAVEKGNDPAQLTAHGFDATTYAILANAPNETVKYLLSFEGNEVNKHTHDGRNYLMWAANKGNIELMNYLYARDSRIDIMDDHGYTLMNFAAAGGVTDPAVYDLLMKNGSDINSTTRQGQNNVLLLVGRVESLDELSYFIEKGIDLNHVDDEGNNAFLHAARYGNIKVMKELIEKGFDPLVTNKAGENAMLFATMGARRSTNGPDVFSYLQSLGLELNTVSNEGNSPLHFLASGNENKDVWATFLSAGVSPDLVNDSGSNALMIALRSRNEVATNQLLHETKNINQVNDEGYSALSYAVMSQSDQFTDLLLSLGADTGVVDANDKNLLTHLYEGTANDAEYFTKYVQVLEKEEIEVQPSILFTAIQKENEFLIEQALKAGVDINSKDGNGNTPLQLAAMKSNNVHFLKFLVEKGADKTITTEFGETAYDLASENEQLEEAIEFLKVEG